MIKMTVTNAVVSKGYNGAPALNISESGETRIARFRIGTTVYDKTAENNRRYVNLTVKAFNGLCTRIESMKLDAGAYVNITGRYDEDTWEDQTTHEKKSMPVLIADEVEYCYSGTNGKPNGDTAGAPANGQKQAPPPTGNGQNQTPPPAGNGQMPDSFTGYEPFGGPNPFFPQG